MKILFIGSKNIGYLCLKQLIEWKKDIVAVIARADDPSPGQWYESVSKLAEENNLLLFKTNNVNEPSFVQKIKELKPDLTFTAQFPQIYKEDFIKISPKGCINLHFAPLPRYRGCFPVPWAIINGEKEFGVTIHHIDVKADHGNIIAQKKFPIDINDTGRSLYDKCSRYGLELFKETFPKFEKEIPAGISQDDTNSLHYKREKPFKGVIDWNKNALEVYNFIRSLYFLPFEAASANFGGKKVNLTSTELTEKNSVGEPGKIAEIVNGTGFFVNTKDKQLLVKKVQIKDNEEMNADEFIRREGITI